MTTVYFNMDRNKIDQQFDRRINKMAMNMAADRATEPIQEYDKEFFTRDIYYEDSKVKANILICLERIKGEVNGVSVDIRGNWILFKVLEVLEGDEDGLISPGAIVLARWDSRWNAYTKYLYKANPSLTDKEVKAIAAITPMSETEIVNGY